MTEELVASRYFAFYLATFNRDENLFCIALFSQCVHNAHSYHLKECFQMAKTKFRCLFEIPPILSSDSVLSDNKEFQVISRSAMDNNYRMSLLWMDV